MNDFRFQSEGVGMAMIRPGDVRVRHHRNGEWSRRVVRLARNVARWFARSPVAHTAQ